MPTRSDRSAFLARMKGGNPYAGKSPQAMFRSLRWGNRPNAEYSINAPEDLIAIGELARFDFTDGGSEKYSEEDAPFLAVGHSSNLVYVIQRHPDGKAMNVPNFSSRWRPIGNVRRTDYYSDKGGEPAYYYHKHEKPYPMLYECSNGCGVLIPAKWKGGPSYVVAEEGIIG